LLSLLAANIAHVFHIVVIFDKHDILLVVR